MQQLLLIAWVGTFQRLDLPGQRQLYGRQQARLSRTILAMNKHDVGVERRMDLAADAAEIVDVEALEDKIVHVCSSPGSN